jgi:hypothetical protein
MDKFIKKLTFGSLDYIV